MSIPFGVLLIVHAFNLINRSLLNRDTHPIYYQSKRRVNVFYKISIPIFVLGFMYFHLNFAWNFMLLISVPVTVLIVKLVKSEQRRSEILESIPDGDVGCVYCGFALAPCDRFRPYCHAPIKSS